MKRTEVKTPWLFWIKVCTVGLPVSIILGGTLFPPLFLLAPLCLIVLIVSLILQRRSVPPEQKAEAKAQLDALRAQQRAALAKRRVLNRARAEARTAVSAELLSTEEVRGRNPIACFFRALFGYCFFGLVGAGVAYTNARSKIIVRSATFRVRYADGHSATETVKVGSERYRVLSKAAGK